MLIVGNKAREERKCTEKRSCISPSVSKKDIENTERKHERAKPTKEEYVVE